jgi:hypothetical protein
VTPLRRLGHHLIAAAVVASVAAAPLVAATPRQDLRGLPAGRWVKLHEQQPTDAVTFTRQAHGGSAFDTRRGRLVLFGSDTHGLDWTNAPLFFDVARRRWERPYESDDPATYGPDEAGNAVAGPGRDHPWAMHTFDAVAYDPVRDELVVASYPKHLEPGRFTDAAADAWRRVARHPTWTYRLAEARWVPLSAEPVHFFPHATAWDSRRNVLVGVKPEGFFELGGEPRRWRRLDLDGAPRVYHHNAVYDPGHDLVLVFGGNDRGNAVTVYDRSADTVRVMPTPGPRPPGSNAQPVAFHAGIARMIALVDVTDAAGARAAQCWAYDPAADAWERMPSADLPFAVGMNYDLQYDAGNDLLWLVAAEPGRPVAVWALRL